MREHNTLILTVNSILYLVWFIINYSKVKKITPYNFMILWTLFIAATGIYCYTSKTYEFTYGIVYTKLNIISYIVVFISFILLFQPLKNLTELKIHEFKKNKLFTLFEIGAILYFVIVLILSVPYYLYAQTIDAETIYSNTQNAQVLIPHFLQLLYRGAMVLTTFFLPYAFYSLKDKISFKSLFTLVVIFLFSYVQATVYASRGALFAALLSFAFIFILIHHLYSKQIKAKLLTIMSAFFIFSIGLGITITLSRFGSSSSFKENIVSYFGESFINYGNKIWDNPTLQHSNGQAYFPYLYSTFSEKSLSVSSLSVKDKSDYLGFIIGSDALTTFSPLYGKLYIEFGKYWPFLIILAFSVLVNIVLKKKKFSFATVPLIVYIFQTYYLFSPISNKIAESSIELFLYVIAFSIILKYSIISDKKLKNNDYTK